MFTPQQYQLEGVGLKKRTAKNFRGTQTTCNIFLKPAVNTQAPVIGVAIGGRSKSLQVGQATRNILKPKSGGKISTLTDMR